MFRKIRVYFIRVDMLFHEIIFLFVSIIYIALFLFVMVIIDCVSLRVLTAMPD